MTPIYFLKSRWNQHGLRLLVGGMLEKVPEGSGRKGRGAGRVVLGERTPAAWQITPKFSIFITSNSVCGSGIRAWFGCMVLLALSGRLVPLKPLLGWGMGDPASVAGSCAGSTAAGCLPNEKSKRPRWKLPCLPSQAGPSHTQSHLSYPVHHPEQPWSAVGGNAWGVHARRGRSLRATGATETSYH